MLCVVRFVWDIAGILTLREPVLVTSGTDNCIKMWVFDSPDGTGRLLRSREGHRAPPRAIRYYGNTTLASMAEGAGQYSYSTPTLPA